MAGEDPRRTGPPEPNGRRNPPTLGESRRWAHSGSEPIRARSDIRLRWLLSVAFAPVFLVGAGVFAYLASVSTGGGGITNRSALVAAAAICAAVELVIVADLLVLRYRIREQRRWGRWDEQGDGRRGRR